MVNAWEDSRVPEHWCTRAKNAHAPAPCRAVCCMNAARRSAPCLPASIMSSSWSEVSLPQVRDVSTCSCPPSLLPLAPPSPPLSSGRYANVPVAAAAASSAAEGSSSSVPPPPSEPSAACCAAQTAAHTVRSGTAASTSAAQAALTAQASTPPSSDTT
ncbi:hypothetical protein ABPG75_008356 [Micractinium tetrahymenae]